MKYARIILSTVAGILSILAVSVAAQRPKEKIENPANFRSTMAHYATVDRSDGKVYELFVNQLAANTWRAEQRLPEGAIFVIESFNAARSADGSLRRNAEGQLIKGSSDNEIHVSEKQIAWAANGECSAPSLMNGRAAGSGVWRMAAFDPRSGQRILRATHKPGECIQCHTDRRAEDSLLSRGLLDNFMRSGRPSLITFECGEREICFGGPARPLSAAEPACDLQFKP